MDPSVFYIWILWMIAIPLGPLLGWLVQKYWAALDRLVRRTIFAFFGVSTAIGLCTLFTPWSFRGFWPQAANLVVAYVSSASLVCVVFKKAPRSFSLFAARGFAVIIALVLYAGLISAYWRTDPPELETRLRNDLVLRRCSGGWAGLDWEGVTIVYRPARLPFLEKTLYNEHIGVTDDCDETSIRVEPDSSSHEILVQCGRQNPYVFARVRMP